MKELKITRFDVKDYAVPLVGEIPNISPELDMEVFGLVTDNMLNVESELCDKLT